MKKSILSTFYLTTFTVFIAFFFILIITTLVHSYNNYKEDIEKIKTEKLKEIKKTIKSEIEFTEKYIQKSREETKQNAKDQVKEHINIAYGIVKNIYEKNKKSKNIEKLISNALKDYRYNNGKNYIFLFKTDGTTVLTPNIPSRAGKNLLNSEKELVRNTAKSLIDIAKSKNEGFYEYFWITKNNLKEYKHKKLAFVKYFKPLDIVIGTGILLSDVDKKIKKRVLSYLDDYRFGINKKAYIFSATYEGISLTGPFKGKNVYDVTDKNGLKIVQELIKKAKEGGGFVNYVLPKGANEELPKISYVKGIDDWNLYIGTGQTVNDINIMIEKSKDTVLNKLYSDLIFNFILGFLVLVIFYFLFKRIQKKSTQKFESFFLKIKDLIKLNKEVDLEKIEFYELRDFAKEVNHLIKVSNENQTKLIDNERAFAQNAKLAQMGEMLSNIAHQWRQPLSTITTSISGLQLKHEHNILEENDIENSYNTIINQANYLTKTIESFRNYLDNDSSFVKVSIRDVILSTIELAQASLNNSYIKLDLDLKDDLIINGNKNELIEAFINIINNSKDVLDELPKDKLKLIRIKTRFSKNKENLQVLIWDTAGGIPTDIINRIFEPYFTTKHKSQGTGLGLSMVDNILRVKHKAVLYACNDNINYENNTYKGALFRVIFQQNN